MPMKNHTHMLSVDWLKIISLWLIHTGRLSYLFIYVYRSFIAIKKTFISWRVLHNSVHKRLREMPIKSNFYYTTSLSFSSLFLDTLQQAFTFNLIYLFIWFFLLTVFHPISANFQQMIGKISSNLFGWCQNYSNSSIEN